ncbi:MAG: glycosyltransferase family 2 protein [candidate division Zixibacteria bacterium]|nr:glycosyltransferase family 2 protein [candidate division Zixibacteria bacterium]
MKKILVLIPAFNAEKTISSLIAQISAFTQRKDILVVDDGSTDRTYQLAKESGANCIQHTRNKGKGEALKTGFEYAVEQGYSGVITLDADLQHDPKFIPEFIKKAENSTSDILVGTRHIELKTMPFSRWLTNNVTSIIVSILGDTKVRDSQSGYRYISTDVLKTVKLSTKKYELESEILIKAGRKGFKIAPVPISTIYHGSKSFINPLVDTGRFIKLMWKSLFW